MEKFKGPFVGRVERFQGLCECWEMFHGPLVDGGGRNILVSCICRTRFQCPDVEVGLRFQDPCGGGGGGGELVLGRRREILEICLEGE